MDYSKDSEFKTPIFPVKTNYNSSQRGLGEEAYEGLIVKNASTTIKKVGDVLTVGEITYDISEFNIMDVVLTLKDKHSVDIKFLGTDVVWQLPAQCILDFTNTEISEVSLTHIPYDLNIESQFKNTGITALQTSVKADVVMSINYSQRAFKQTGSFITDVKDYSVTDKALIKVTTTDFLLKISDAKFTTTKTSVLAKHLDKVTQ
jgi:hypothetical protein